MLVSSPSTTAGRLSTEIVFSGLFTVWGRELLEAYAGEGEAFCGQKDVWEQLEPLYDRYLNNGSTFAFQYVTSGGSTLEEPTLKTSPPCQRDRGGVYLCHGTCSSGDSLRGYKKRPVRDHVRSAAGGGHYGLPGSACISCLSQRVCRSGSGGSAHEASRGSRSSSALWLQLHSLFLGSLPPGQKSFWSIACLIPFFYYRKPCLLPCFVDLSLFLPALKTAGKLFLPWYYLKAAAFL